MVPFSGCHGYVVMTSLVVALCWLVFGKLRVGGYVAFDLVFGGIPVLHSLFSISHAAVKYATEKLMFCSLSMFILFVLHCCWVLLGVVGCCWVLLPPIILVS